MESNNGKSRRIINQSTGSYCLVLLAERLIGVVSEYVTLEYEERINRYLDNLMVDRVSAMELEFFDSSSLKDHTVNSWNLIYCTKKIVTFVFEIVEGIVRVVISGTLLLALSPLLIPAMFLLSVPSILCDRATNKMFYDFEKKKAPLERKQEYFKRIFFGGDRQEIRLYRLRDFFVSRVNGAWEELEQERRALDFKTGLLDLLAWLAMAVNEIAVYILAVVKLAAGEIGVGDVAYYVSVVSRFRDDINHIAYRFNEFDRNADELNDVRGFLEMEPLMDKSGTRMPGKNPVIEFRNVSFHYPNAQRNILENCSFTVKWGEKVGLVGTNGSGKSTLVKLLCRFYDPTGGRILLDGADYREYDIDALRALFGVLFQDYVRYSMTLRENVALGDEARISEDAAILDACKKSKVSDFAGSWEKGLEEELTRRFQPEGKELSGGQWQRVSLARAFFRDAPIILLDEPSAALDPLAEYEIFKDFSRLSQDKGAVLVSHRLSNITIADKILVLEGGHIIEQGSHEELLARKGRYAYLFGLQAGKYFS